MSREYFTAPVENFLHISGVAPGKNVTVEPTFYHDNVIMGAFARRDDYSSSRVALHWEFTKGQNWSWRVPAQYSELYIYTILSHPCLASLEGLHCWKRDPVSLFHTT